VTQPREKPGIQPCSSKVKVLGVALALCGLSQGGGKNLHVSAGGVKVISRFDWHLDDH
jgi:hypothetical protein